MAKLNTADFDGNSALEADILGMFRDMERLQTNLNKIISSYRSASLETPPNLSIGSDSKKIAYDAFTYTVRNDGKSKVADTLGVTLTGSDVPTNEWGAWAIDIDADGVITVEVAPDNATGYDLRRDGVVAIGDPQNNKVRLGYVAIRNKTGAYQPNTTDLTGADMVIYLSDDPDGYPQPEFTRFETNA